jgi:hypothetical protein
MENLRKSRVKEIIKERGFQRTGKRDLWVRGSWTIRFFEDDIEIYDSIEESGKYLVQNINSVNINLVLADIE